MSTLLLARPDPVGQGLRSRSRSGSTLAAAVLGFFVLTLDAVVVKVALPSIPADLGGGITGWCRRWAGWSPTASRVGPRRC